MGCKDYLVFLGERKKAPVNLNRALLESDILALNIPALVCSSLDPSAKWVATEEAHVRKDNT